MSDKIVEKKKSKVLGNLIKLLVTVIFLYIVVNNIQWHDNIFVFDSQELELGKVVEVSKDGQSIVYENVKTKSHERVFLNSRFKIEDDFYVVMPIPYKLGDPTPYKVNDFLKVRSCLLIEGDFKDGAVPKPVDGSFDFIKLGEQVHQTIKVEDLAGGLEYAVVPGVPNLMRSINLQYFFIAFFMIVVSQALPVIRWRILLASCGIHMTLLKAFKITYMGYFFSVVLPSVGDVVRAVYVAKDNEKEKAAAALSVLIDRVVGLFSVVMIGAIAILINFNDPSIADYRSEVLILMSALFASAIIYFSVSLRKLIGFEWLLDHLPMGGRLRRIEEKLFVYRTRKMALTKAFIITFFVQCNFIMVNYFLAISLGMGEGHLADFFIIIPIITVFVAIPISMGGFGVREALFMKFFTTFLINPSIGVATAILQWVLMAVWSLPGILAFFSLKKEHKSEPSS